MDISREDLVAAALAMKQEMFLLWFFWCIPFTFPELHRMFSCWISGLLWSHKTKVNCGKLMPRGLKKCQPIWYSSKSLGLSFLQGISFHTANINILPLLYVSLHPLKMAFCCKCAAASITLCFSVTAFAERPWGEVRFRQKRRSFIYINENNQSSKNTH